jgi:hypothetical protein
VYTAYNFGSDVLPPVFEFVQDEDLYAGRMERDVKLYSISWRPKKAYITREYGIPEEDFELAGGEKTFAVPARRFLGLFASKEERARRKGERLMAGFEQPRLRSGQDGINTMLDTFADVLGTAGRYEDASAALIGVCGRADAGRFACL